MSVTQHRASAPISVPCFVLSISDTRSFETDASGRAIAALLTEHGHVVAGREIVPDDRDGIAALIRRVVTEDRVRVVIATGGTGISPRDATIEALNALIEKPLPGFGEIFRRLSFDEIGSAALLSRAVAGIAGRCAIFALPGSEHAVRLAMSRLILPELGHIASELTK